VTALALVLGVAIAAAAVLLVSLPFLREPVVADDRLDAPTDADRAGLVLAEERDQALAALRELEFDHRTGKITDDDYRRDVGPLRQAAARALRRHDETQEARMSELQSVPEPSPPPDEGTLPSPAPVPEPAPPPDEATIPSVPEE
jgi:hypothetical protein